MRSSDRGLFARVFRVSRYHAWWVLLIALVVTGLGVYFIRDVPIRSSYFDLLPQDDPIIEEYRQYEETLALTDQAAILLRLVEPEGIPIEERKVRLLDAAAAIVEVLAAEPEIELVQYLNAPSLKIPDPYLLLSRLEPSEIERFQGSLALATSSLTTESLSRLPTGVDLTEAYRKVGDAFNRALLSGELDPANVSGTGGVESQLSEMLMLNATVLEVIRGIRDFPEVTAAIHDLEGLFAPSAEVVTREPEGLFSRDAAKLVVSVRPRFASSRGVAYSREITEILERALIEIDVEGRGLSAGITGAYAFAAATADVVNSDMLRTTIISSIGVLIIFFLAFGSVFYSVVAVIPLGISVVLTTGWAKVAVGGFNLITTFLPALVLGLGIDYAIHLISRYAEERGKGASLNRALYTAVIRKGQASMYAAITTSLVFLGLLFSKSRGMFEMGIITSVGVQFAFITTLFVVPTLITLAHFLLRYRHRERVLNYGPHLTPLFRAITGKGRAVFTIVIVLTFFVSFQAARTSFQFSSNDLVPRTESTEVLNEILGEVEAETQLGNTVTFFPSSEEDLKRVTSRLEENPYVSGVQSALQFLPVNLKEQQEFLSGLGIPAYVVQLDTLNHSLAGRDSAMAEIRSLLAQFGLLQYGATMSGRAEIALTSRSIQNQLRAVQFEFAALSIETATARVLALQAALIGLSDKLEQLLDLPPLESLLKDFLLSLPQSFRGQYLTNASEYVVKARVSDAIFVGSNRHVFAAFADELEVPYFGLPLTVGQLEKYMKRDFIVSTALAVVLIALVLWRSLRGWIRGLLAGLPLILGYVWMLGGMRLLEIDFNFINITISPLLIGIGVDSGIHIMHRYFEERAKDPQCAIERGSQATAVAVVVTSLTTMLVFGCLLIARTPGLRFLGASAILGIGFSLLFSLIFLPAALRVLEKRV